MNNKQTGWTLAIAALAMMFGLLAIDIGKLNSWSELATPSFIASFLGHLASIGTAFVGGKLIPTEPHNQREGDK